MIKTSSKFWIDHLQLTQHIEGGWYSEVYRSLLSFNKEQLPAEFNGDRNSCTHIYFLLEKNNFSAFHRIKSDELWHFYAGDPMIIYEIDKAGDLTKHLLGNDPLQEQSFFCVIKAGNWFASKVANDGEYGLVGCTVSPGFDFNDFEMAKRKELASNFPQHSELITDLTHED